MQDAALLLPPPSSMFEPIGGCPPDDYMIPRSYLAGLTLSNDGGTPNSILDIAAGQCIDSTNAFVINLGAITKSTAGSWAAGSGQNGMGTGLSIAASTWYHVFAILNGGSPDVYFDTSISGNNAPAGTKGFRRIGSFKTDGSSHIIAFTQNGDEFLWKTPIQDMSAVATSASAASKTFTVPTGLEVWALFKATLSWSSGAVVNSVFYPLDMGTQASGTPTGYNDFISNSSSTLSSGSLSVRTNTSAQVGWVSSATTGLVSAATYGWIDARGQSN